MGISSSIDVDEIEQGVTSDQVSHLVDAFKDGDVIKLCKVVLQLEGGPGVWIDKKRISKVDYYELFNSPVSGSDGRIMTEEFMRSAGVHKSSERITEIFMRVIKFPRMSNEEVDDVLREVKKLNIRPSKMQFLETVIAIETGYGYGDVSVLSGQMGPNMRNRARKLKYFDNLRDMELNKYDVRNDLDAMTPSEVSRKLKEREFGNISYEELKKKEGEIKKKARDEVGENLYIMNNMVDMFVKKGDLRQDVVDRVLENPTTHTLSREYNNILTNMISKSNHPFFIPIMKDEANKHPDLTMRDFYDEQEFQTSLIWNIGDADFYKVQLLIKYMMRKMGSTEELNKWNYKKYFNARSYSGLTALSLALFKGYTSVDGIPYSYGTEYLYVDTNELVRELLGTHLIDISNEKNESYAVVYAMNKSNYLKDYWRFKNDVLPNPSRAYILGPIHACILHMNVDGARMLEAIDSNIWKIGYKYLDLYEEHRENYDPTEDSDDLRILHEKEREFLARYGSEKGKIRVANNAELLFKSWRHAGVIASMVTEFNLSILPDHESYERLQYFATRIIPNKQPFLDDCIKHVYEELYAYEQNNTDPGENSGPPSILELDIMRMIRVIVILRIEYNYKFPVYRIKVQGREDVVKKKYPIKFCQENGPKFADLSAWITTVLDKNKDKTIIK